MIALAIGAGVLVALTLSLVRVFVGPTLYDRVLAAIGVVVAVSALCGALAVAARRWDLVDVALALLIGVFVTAVGVLKFFRARSFQAAMAPSSGE